MVTFGSHVGVMGVEIPNINVVFEEKNLFFLLIIHNQQIRVFVKKKA
jgi:hypothetical protein